MLTIANQDEIELLGVQVEVSLPQQLNSFSVSEVSDPEATRCAGRNLAPCQARERLIWTPDRIGAGEVLTFTFPPTFDRASTSLGSLYGFTARATESQGTSARARTTVELGWPKE